MVISIHAPREGSDLFAVCAFAGPSHFYPRSPRGERLWKPPVFRAFIRYFYPRSPRGERRQQNAGIQLNFAISIHAPREGSDEGISLRRWRLNRYFYPRSPRGERPAYAREPLDKRDFYPRSPRGERPSRTPAFS